jgi:ABC-2 type transport system ATP-binding protein
VRLEDQCELRRFWQESNGVLPSSTCDLPFRMRFSAACWRPAVLEPAALEVSGLTKRYGSREALANVDLSVQPGQLHGLLGPNGAGKTTLMRVLLGLAARDAGSVRMLGEAVDWMGGALPLHVAGFIETPAFYPYLSGHRNLMLLASLDGLTAGARRSGVDEVIARTGLTEQADQAAGTYSAGMRQRLGLAAALLRAPRLLFLDEPTSALDPEAARDVRALVRRLAADGTAVVFSSHDLAEVEALCEVVTVLDRGRVAFSGTIQRLRGLGPAGTYRVRTSDDARAAIMGSSAAGVAVAPGSDGGLELSASLEALDAFVIALGRDGIAIRALDPRGRSLESWFLASVGRRGREEQES